MGTGISGAILLEFSIETSRKEEFIKSSVNGFLDNYKILPESEGGRYEKYLIKDEVLVPNYAEFLKEFHTLIYDEFKGFDGPYDYKPDEACTTKLLSCKTREEFDDVFSRKNRNATSPFICSMLSVLDCYRNTPFVFYMGSYKALLEEYSTLTHMERMLAKAMKNPLKTSVKFGIYG